ncbi:alpha/beta fold hydrolase [Sphingomonas lutea]|uniref:Alpha/beta fold hydrolase n=1 Tax=Sphingomonas lutea TaxID=1045317 RepID=A0A7G9SJA2_9SPHN|nr:alpha/beta fold hydrolase [Sphingomonas lutea]QNN67927.1 alpha/beta fold hydrolase [Sphingomonas lutea]
MGRINITDGRAIGYVESGDGDATPVVFLHGVGSDKSVWRPQLDHFGKQRRALAFDYPGYGDSDPAPQGTTRDDYAEAILAAMTALGIERAHVCGLSLGGVVAIAMHHAAPGRISSLVLADTFAKHPGGQGIYQRSVAGSADMRALAEARVDVLIANPLVRDDVVETMARIDPAAYRIGAEAVWLANQADRAREIRVPTLITCGTEDKVTPPALSAQLMTLIPGARFPVIGRAGHLSNLEQPETFNALVANFIKSVEETA